MSAWADGLFRTSIQGGIAILLCALLFRVFSRIPGRVQVWVWRTVAFKFLLGLIVPVTAWTLAGHEGEGAYDPLPGIVMVFTAIGLLIALVSIVRDGISVRRLGQGGTPIELPMLHDLCERIKLRRQPRILLRTDLDRPLLTGIFKPTIHLPSGLSEVEQAMVISHELAHIKRGDLAWEWLFVSLESVFFFHPLVWLMRREHRLAREVACDEIAIRTAGASLKQYGRMLMDMTTSNRTPDLALTANMASTYGVLRARIVRLHRASRIGALSLIALTLVTIALIPTWRIGFRVSDEFYPFSPEVSVTVPVINSDSVVIGGEFRTLKEGRS